MTPSDPNSKDRLRDTVMELLWAQWSALGVAGHASAVSPHIVDPEALLLLSTEMARGDARLFDEVEDWLRRNGTWINLQRLQTLERDEKIGNPTVLAALAERLSTDSAHAKWKVLMNDIAPLESPRPLFPGIPVFQKQDPVFVRWGWRRPPFEDRGLSRPPNPDSAAAFLLKLRALFGRQSRAEVMAWLLTHSSGHPAQIARDTGYFRGSVQIALNELTTSGHVFASRVGREKVFALRHDEWRFLLTWEEAPRTFPRWIPWPLLFALVRRVFETLDSPTYAKATEKARWIELRKNAHEAVSKMNADGTISLNLPEGGNTREFLDQFTQMLPTGNDADVPTR